MNKLSVIKLKDLPQKCRFFLYQGRRYTVLHNETDFWVTQTVSRIENKYGRTYEISKKKDSWTGNEVIKAII